MIKQDIWHCIGLDSCYHAASYLAKPKHLQGGKNHFKVELIDSSNKWWPIVGSAAAQSDSIDASIRMPDQCVITIQWKRTDGVPRA